MHIPAYAHATIRVALPPDPTDTQAQGLNCCLCSRPFEALAPVALTLVAESDLSACRPCLTQLVSQARQSRDAAYTEEARRVRSDQAKWIAARDRYLAQATRVRQAAESVARLACDDNVTAHGVAWLYVALESAYAWGRDGEPTDSQPTQSTISIKEASTDVFIAMTLAREAIADRLAYHVINQDLPLEPEACAELDCPEGCSGKHEWSEIDCGPDAIFDHLQEYGVSLEPQPHLPPGKHPEATL
jgi:hypothetical protein